MEWKLGCLTDLYMRFPKWSTEWLPIYFFPESASRAQEMQTVLQMARLRRVPAGSLVLAGMSTET